MQHGIREFRPRQPLDRQLSSDTLNRILRELESLRITRVVNGTFKKLPGGTEIVVAPQRGGGTPATPQPFQLAVVNVSETEEPDWKIRVYASTLAGGSSIDLGFAEGDDPPYLLEPLAGVVQGGITIDNEGNITSRWLELVEELSKDSSDEEGQTFYVEIGTVAQDEETETFSVTNSQYGPITAVICRQWFTSEPPLYVAQWFGNS